MHPIMRIRYGRDRLTRIVDDISRDNLPIQITIILPSTARIVVGKGILRTFSTVPAAYA